MEVKIGVQHAPREVTLDVDDTADGIEKRVSEAIATPDGVLTLTDAKSRRRVVVPSAKVAYVEIGTGVAGQVGFRS